MSETRIEDYNLNPHDPDDPQSEENPEGESDVFEAPRNEYNIVEHVIAGVLDYSNECMGQNGELVYGTYVGQGYKDKNEDAQVINTTANAFASIDGMGGMGHGDLAARILAEEIQKGFQGNISIEEVQKNASERMNDEGVGSGGACYIAGKINGNKLDVYQAGDVKLIVVGKDGQVKFETIDQGGPLGVYNTVQGTKPGTTAHYEVFLEEGDKIITASDGLWNNLTPEQVAEVVISEVSPKQAYWALQNAAVDKMATEEGKSDNINIIIYKYEREVPEEKGGSVAESKKLEELLEGLNWARKKYAQEKWLYDQRVKETDGDIDMTGYHTAKKRYESLVQSVRGAMYDKVDQEAASIPENEREVKKRKMIERILVDTVVKESDKLFDAIQEAKFEHHPHETLRNIKNSLFNIVNTYRKLPLKYKFGFSGLLLAGGVAAGLGAVTAPAALTGLFIGATTQRMFGGASTAVSTEAGLQFIQNWLDKRRLLKEFKNDPLEKIIMNENYVLDRRLEKLVGKKQKQKFVRYTTAGIIGGAIMLGLPRKLFEWLEWINEGGEGATGSTRPQDVPSRPTIPSEPQPPSVEGGGSRLTGPRPPAPDESLGATPESPSSGGTSQSPTVGEGVRPDHLTGPRGGAPNEGTGAVLEEGPSSHPEPSPSPESTPAPQPTIGPQTPQTPYPSETGASSSGSATAVSPWEKPASGDFSASYTPEQGGSVWKGIRQKLIERYGNDFTSLPKGRRIFIINELKNYVEANQGEFGLDNVHGIEKGQPIDFSKIFDEKDGIASKTLKKAMDLSEERVHKIEDYAKAASVRKTIEQAMAAGTEEVVKTEVPVEIVPENIPNPSVSSTPSVPNIPVPENSPIETGGVSSSVPNVSVQPPVPENVQDASEPIVSLEDQERLGKMIEDQKLKEAESELTQLDPTAPVHFSGELIGTLKEIGFSNEQFLTFIRKGVTVGDIMDKNSLPREGGWKFWQNGSFNHAVKQLQTYIEVHGASAEQPGVLSEGVRNMKIKDFMDQAIAGQRLYQ